MRRVFKIILRASPMTLPAIIPGTRTAPRVCLSLVFSLWELLRYLVHVSRPLFSSSLLLLASIGPSRLLLPTSGMLRICMKMQAPYLPFATRRVRLFTSCGVYPQVLSFPLATLLLGQKAILLYTTCVFRDIAIRRLG